MLAAYPEHGGMYARRAVFGPQQLPVDIRMELGHRYAGKTIYTGVIRFETDRLNIGSGRIPSGWSDVSPAKGDSINTSKVTLIIRAYDEGRIARLTASAEMDGQTRAISAAGKGAVVRLPELVTPASVAEFVAGLQPFKEKAPVVKKTVFQRRLNGGRPKNPYQDQPGGRKPSERKRYR